MKPTGLCLALTLLVVAAAQADDLLPTLKTTRGISLVEQNFAEADYVCSSMFSQTGFRLQKDDNDHAGPDKAAPLGEHPLIASEKHSVMFVMGAERAVRNLKAWEARPNAEWETSKIKLPASSPK